MYCPAGYVLNPHTRRCVIATGKTAADLVRRGAIPPIHAAGPPNRFRMTIKNPRATAAAPAAIYMDTPCNYDQERNPRTGRCVKIGGRTHKRLGGRELHRRAVTDPFGQSQSSLAPLTDRSGILEWTRASCRNQVDTLTGQPFVSQDTASLQKLVRLHNNTCASSDALNRQTYIDRVNGRPTLVPGPMSSFEPLTAADHAAIAASQNRVGTGTGYAFPTTAAPAAAGRRVPRPAEWQLYIAQDARSGPEYASILIVDVTRARVTAAGTEYPAESIRIDLGFIPVTVSGGVKCTPQTLVDRIQRLDKRGALTFLDPASGRWKPIAPFPLPKTFWASGRSLKMAQLCADLAT